VCGYSKKNSTAIGLHSKLRVARNGSRPGSHSFSRGALYTLLRNPIYVGEIRHKGTRYPGQHQPIIARVVWDRVQELLQLHTVRTIGSPNGSTRSPLVGKLFDEAGKLKAVARANQWLTELLSEHPSRSKRFD
jgi:site-specific DNA recombinase